jgi:uncharacterized protein YciI
MPIGDAVLTWIWFILLQLVPWRELIMNVRGWVACVGIALAIIAVPAFSRPAAKPAYDAALAEKTGADEHGMRHYVLVILKTGPRRMPEGKARDAMFAGHFANIQRLAKDGKLVLAGPFGDDPEHWRGLFLFAVPDIAEAKRLTATDPVIRSGEMTAEYHAWYGSAAAMTIPDLHERIVAKPF